MGENIGVQLEGFVFECIGVSRNEEGTEIVIRVSGNGKSAHELNRWALELCADDTECFGIDVISCEKRKLDGAWVPAVAQKTTYELTGDIGISGILFEEPIGKGTDDPTIEYKVVLDSPLDFDMGRVAYISGSTVLRSMISLPSKKKMEPDMIWETPIEKPFCLYVVIPEGYKPVGACKTNLSILKHGLYLAREEVEASVAEVETEQDNVERMTIATRLLGSVKIIASIPLKSHHACGDQVCATACDCFELCEIIGYTRNDAAFQMRDVSVCLKKKSLDLTLLNARCGKSVYRLDGAFVVSCKRCLKQQ